MNAELRHAQVELLSAEVAANRIRLRFSLDDVARFGERDVLYKAAASANALSDYYTNVVRLVSNPSSMAPPRASAVQEEKKAIAAIENVRRYFRDQRKEYRPQGLPLGAGPCSTMERFFPPTLLAGVRIVELRDQLVPNPSFFDEVKAQGLTNVPDLAHMDSLTFEDIVVFPAEMTDRRLFHALVHVVQFAVLGFERYTEFLIRGLFRTRSYATAPLEMHAFSLEAKFAANPNDPFSVEEAVRLWTNQGRY
ncbi:MAG: hypothetical protein WBW53_02575 [Terriglobales bacterium]